MRISELYRKTGLFSKVYALTITTTIDEAASDEGVREIAEAILGWIDRRKRKADHVQILVECPQLPSEEVQDSIAIRYHPNSDLARAAERTQTRIGIAYIDREGQWHRTINNDVKREAVLGALFGRLPWRSQ